MDRRTFVQLAASVPLMGGPTNDPVYKVVTPFKPTAKPGIPGPFPGQVVRVHSDKSLDTTTDTADRAVVKQMLSAGIRALTGAGSDAEAWSKFIAPNDVVGIKVNCGNPGIPSAPELVAGIVENLVAIGVPAARIYVYDRFDVDDIQALYSKFLPAGVQFWAAEFGTYKGMLGYNPSTYVENSFFGEDDTRSFLNRLVVEKITKIINVPSAKEHQAAGVTGCLKNLAFGNFYNTGRCHQYERTNARTFIGVLTAVEPLRSRAVLNIMDGLRGVWHLGPFRTLERFRFFPKLLMIGTDPVAMDQKLIELVEAKRKAEGAVSIFDRDPSHLSTTRNREDPNFNAFIREPGHVEFAASLGLGISDSSAIRTREIEL